MLSGGKVAGLSRLLQGEGVCMVEGSLSGVQQGVYEAQVHKRGDITQGVESCGEVFGKGKCLQVLNLRLIFNFN